MYFIHRRHNTSVGLLLFFRGLDKQINSAQCSNFLILNVTSVYMYYVRLYVLCVQKVCMYLAVYTCIIFIIVGCTFCSFNELNELGVIK